MLKYFPQLKGNVVIVLDFTRTAHVYICLSSNQHNNENNNNNNNNAVKSTVSSCSLPFTLSTKAKSTVRVSCHLLCQQRQRVLFVFHAIYSVNKGKEYCLYSMPFTLSTKAKSTVCIPCHLLCQQRQRVLFVFPAIYSVNKGKEYCLYSLPFTLSTKAKSTVRVPCHLLCQHCSCFLPFTVNKGKE